MEQVDKAHNTQLIKEEENIPIFRKWRSWYILVLVVLFLLIGFFYLFTYNFA